MPYRINGHALEGEGVATVSRWISGQQVGVLTLASQFLLDAAFAAAQRALADWAATPVTARAACLERLAEVAAGAARRIAGAAAAGSGQDAGRRAGNELREAIDYCLYAQQARGLSGQPLQLDAVAARANQLSWRARGCFCLHHQPVNFPLAIFIGR